MKFSFRFDEQDVIRLHQGIEARIATFDKEITDYAEMMSGPRPELMQPYYDGRAQFEKLKERLGGALKRAEQARKQTKKRRR